MRHSLWRWLPPLDLTRLRKTERFPPPPPRPLTATAVCIATKSRNLGDALILTSLPRRLAAQYPELRIDTALRAFNPVVFLGNPWVRRPLYLPARIYGDDANLGHGHQIELKERFFGLLPEASPKPEIYLLPHEQAWALRERRTADDRPIALIHCWGHTRKKTLAPTAWQKIVAGLQPEASIWQLGLEGQPPIAGCDRYFFLPPQPAFARKLFAIASQAQAFIGVDSGPMHVARAFELPSLIVVEQAGLAERFVRRRQAPYFLYSNRTHAFLYEQNTHLSVVEQDEATIVEKAIQFGREALRA